MIEGWRGTMGLKAIVAAALLLAPGAALSRVDVGRADWDALPELQAQPRQFPTPGAVEFMERVLRHGECELAGQSHKQFDITVPYAVLVKPDGNAERVVVSDMGCPPLESYVGTVVLMLSRDGAFHATGEAEPSWYASSLNFNLK